MRIKTLSLALLFSALLPFAPLYACPLIDGLVDVNCDQTLKIGFVGDSFVRGYGDKTGVGGGYVTRFTALYPNATITRYGVPGVVSGKLLSKLMRKVPRMKNGPAESNLRDADYVFVDVGRNDYWELDDPPETVSNIKRIVKYLKQKLPTVGNPPPVIVVATLAPTTRSFQHGFIFAVNDLLNKRKGNALPAYIRLDKIKSTFISKDGIHPTSEGYDKITQLYQAYIQDQAQQRALAMCGDSDGDGIYDKAELSRFGTDPLIADTDGDSVPDGQEVFTDLTDPLDPSSHL